MTITIDETHTTTLKLLARGRDPEWVAQATGRKAADVEEIGRKYGWPDLPQLRANLDGAGVADTAPQHQPGPRPPVSGPSRTPPAAASTPAAGGLAHTPPRPVHVNGENAGKLELLLARCGKQDNAKIRAARNAVLTACTRLEGHLQRAEVAQRERNEREAAKAAARSRVELLEKQLRDAKAELRGKKPAATTSTRSTSPAAPQNGGSDAKVIRKWAAANGVDCPDRGPLPNAVREAYSAAQGEARTA